MAFRIPLLFHPPYDWPRVCNYLEARAIPGVEQARDEVYGRTFSIGRIRGTLEVRRESGRALVATVHARDSAAVRAQVERRLRRQFDLDLNPRTVRSRLARSDLLRPLLEENGVPRLLGAFDVYELGVRAILGQQISVTGATALAGRLVERFGEPLSAPGRQAESLTPWRLFPPPAVLAAADVASLGMPRSRGASISGFAEAFVPSPDWLEELVGVDEVTAALTALPGIGPWTASYIAMRGLRFTDAFPAADLGLLRAAAGKDGLRPTPRELEALAEAWRPLRGYAAMCLWQSSAGASGG